MHIERNHQDKILKSILMILIACLMTLWLAYALLGHQFLRSVYEGNSIKLFEKFLMQGRAAYSLEKYFDEFDFRVNILFSLIVIAGIFTSMCTGSNIKITKHHTLDPVKLSPYFLTISLSVIAWLFFHLTYQSVDDIYHPLLFKNLYWYGFSADYGYYLSFLHPLLSWLLKSIYSIAPDYYWYDLTLWITNLASCAVLVMVSMRNLNVRMSPWILLIAVYYFLPILIELQFSITAILSAGAGTLLLQLTVLNNKDSIPSRKMEMVVGICLVILGCSIRFEAALISIAFVLAVVLLVNFNRFSKRAIIRKQLYLFGAIIGVVGLLIVIKSFLLPSSIEQFWTANSHRAFVGEYNENLPAHVKEALLTETGWTENDFIMIKEPILTNPEMFNNDKFEKAYTVISNWRMNNCLDLVSERWRNAFDKISRSHLKNYIIFIGFISFAFWGWKNIPKIIIPAAGLLAVFILISIYFKPLPYRMYWGLMTISFFIILSHVDPDVFLSKKMYIQGLLILFCALIVFKSVIVLHDADRYRQHSYLKTVNDVKKLIDNSPPDLLAIRGGFRGMLFYRPFTKDPYPNFTKIPIIRLNLRILSPQSREHLRHATGYSGSLFLCNQNSNILLITEKDGLKLFETELREHFGLTASFISAFNGEIFNAYRCEINK